MLFSHSSTVFLLIRKLNGTFIAKIKYIKYNIQQKHNKLLNKKWLNYHYTSFELKKKLSNIIYSSTHSSIAKKLHLFRGNFSFSLHNKCITLKLLNSIINF